jgi:hypothetical protein
MLQVSATNLDLILVYIIVGSIPNQTVNLKDSLIIVIKVLGSECVES